MKKFRINQVDRYLDHYTEIKKLPSPKHGWTRYIRNALGMTAEQLAKRLGVNRRRVVKIEEAEREGATTLKTLDEVAKAMHCRLIYAIVPETSVNDILQTQARAFAKKRLAAVSHHMTLESQTVEDKKAIAMQVEDMVQKYLSKSLKVIWDE